MQSTATSFTKVPVTLRIAFENVGSSDGVGNLITLKFNDGFQFVWNPTLPYTSVQTTLWFGQTPRNIPDEYLNTVVINNLSSNVWAWPSTTGSTMNPIAVPSGYLTLYGMMNAIYEASQSVITSEQYEDITGFEYQGSDDSLTVATALTDASAANQSTPSFSTVTVESGGLLRISC